MYLHVHKYVLDVRRSRQTLAFLVPDIAGKMQGKSFFETYKLTRLGLECTCTYMC